MFPTFAALVAWFAPTAIDGALLDAHLAAWEKTARSAET